MSNYILALDQGTTSSRAIIFDHSGTIVSLAQKEFPQFYPQPGWVEHDPAHIWSSQKEVAATALKRANLTASDIKAIGITNQRETTLVWDKKTGEPIHNAIVWQCRRTAPIVETLKEKGLGDHIREHTGLVADAYFSATKIAWILDNVEGARERAKNGELLFGTVDSFLVWKLTGGKRHVTDRTNASRTMLYDIHRLRWDETLLEALGIPAEILPAVHPSGFHFGDTDPGLFGAPIPIMGIAGDQQAALFGQCCFEKGMVKNTYGTGCFLLMHTGNEVVGSKNGLISTIAATFDNQPCEYALEGSVFIAGAAIQWLRDELHLIETAAESELCAEEVSDTAGVYLVPAFTGLGAPYWNPNARGIMTGITRGFGREHFVRAALESICYQTADVIEAMEEDIGQKIQALRVDGGASANDFLMRFQADILETIVERPACIETTALGAAYIAGLKAGFWASAEEIKENYRVQAVFEAGISHERREELKDGWKRAIRSVAAWTAH